MKKILFGLAAMSTLAFSAINLKSPTNETNTWMTGEIGAITVNGTITSAVPQVQYVVYASNDDGVTREDTLVLSDFIITQNEATCGFSAANPKIYVKRVAAGNAGVEELQGTDTVSFQIKTDSQYTGAAFTSWHKEGQSIELFPTSLVPRATLDAIIDSGLLYEMVVSEKLGILQNPQGDTFYIQPKNIFVSQNSKGVIEFTSQARTLLPDGKVTSMVNDIQKAFIGGVTLDNVRILVKLD